MRSTTNQYMSALVQTCFDALQAVPLSLFAVERDVRTKWLVVPLCQARKSLLCVLEGLFEIVLSSTKTQQ